MVLAETTKAAESVIAAFRQLDANILVQEYIKEAGGTDIRCLRGGQPGGGGHASGTSAPGEFRSNLHRGGTAAKVRSSRPRSASIAVRGRADHGAQRCGRRHPALATTGRW